MIRLRKQARWTGFVILGLVLMLAGRGESAGPVLRLTATMKNRGAAAHAGLLSRRGDDPRSGGGLRPGLQRRRRQGRGRHWTADGQYTDEDGNVFGGRDAMEKQYAGSSPYLRDHRGEHRVAAVSGGGDRRGKRDCPRHAGRRRAPTAARYTLVHVKRGEMAAGRRARRALHGRRQRGPPQGSRVADRPVAAGFPRRNRGRSPSPGWAKRTSSKTPIAPARARRRRSAASRSSAGTPSWAASSPGTSTPRAVSATTSGPRTARSG